MKAIRNSMLLKISGAAEAERDTLVAASRAVERNFLKFISIQAALGGLPLLGGVFVVLALLEAHSRTQFFSIAELVPFVYLLSRLAGAISNLISNISAIRYYRMFFSRFVALREKIFVTGSPPHSGLPISELARLDVQDLAVGRDGVLVGGITAHLSPGEMLLSAGPSGRGKTTLLMTLVGLVTAQAGAVRWNGIRIEEVDLWKLRERIGYAGPDPYLLDASIEDNLRFGRPRPGHGETDYRNALSCAEASFVFELGGGLRHVLRESGDGVSAGQKQRIAIARAILRQPDVLILDEATGNVDEETEAAIIGNIRRDYPKLMIIAVLHRRSLEAFATSILRL
jgi:ABC-type multidrug transport system fused ATPase/permease subunit